MRRLTVRTWTTVIGAPSPATTASAKSTTSPTFADSRKARKERTFPAMRLPSRTAATIVAKLSSVSTIDDASRAASVPPWPMATPTCARRSAGASFTPSPVTTTISPVSSSASTSASLSAGVQRATTSSSREPQLPADRLRGARVVAGQHPHREALLARGQDRLGGFRPERIHEPDDPQRLRALLEVVVLGRDVPSREGEHAETALGPLVGEPREPLSLATTIAAETEHDLGCALHHRVEPGVVADEDCGALPGSLERDASDNRAGRRDTLAAGGCQQCAIDRVDLRLRGGVGRREARRRARPPRQVRGTRGGDGSP